MWLNELIPRLSPILEWGSIMASQSLSLPLFVKWEQGWILLALDTKVPGDPGQIKGSQASTLAVPKESQQRVKHTLVAPRDKEIMFLHAELDQVQP